MTIRIDGTNTTANPGITGADADTGLQFGTNELKLVTGGTEAVKIDSNQKLTASQGILFGTDTAAANTLDDYEEGTWTPTLVSLDGNLSVTYSTNTHGFYTKIGRLVQISGRVELATSNSSGDALFIQGLPFTSATSSGSRPGFGNIAEVANFAANKNPHGLMVTNNTTQMQLRIIPETSNSSNPSGTDTTNSTRMLFIAQYIVS